MKVREVIAAILAYHPDIGGLGVDTLKFGDPEAEVTGIVTTCTPTIEVIRKTAALGCNLIITHEPTFYTHEDETGYLQGDAVFEEKCRLLRDAGIAVWRDHDHIHAHRPDGIYDGVMRELGWEAHCVDDVNRPKLYDLPPVKVGALVAFLKEKMALETVRVVGNTEATVSRLLYMGGGYVPMDESMTRMVTEKRVDVYLAGELVDWTVLSYLRDAGQLGHEKVLIQIGHFNGEELGMKHYPTWLQPLVGDAMPIHFVRSGEPYRYL